MSWEGHHIMVGNEIMVHKHSGILSGSKENELWNFLENGWNCLSVLAEAQKDKSIYSLSCADSSFKFWYLYVQVGGE